MFLSHAAVRTASIFQAGRELFGGLFSRDQYYSFMLRWRAWQRQIAICVPVPPSRAWASRSLRTIVNAILQDLPRPCSGALEDGHQQPN